MPVPVVWVGERMQAARDAMRMCVALLHYPQYHHQQVKHLEQMVRACDRIRQLLDELDSLPTPLSSESSR